MKIFNTWLCLLLVVVLLASCAEDDPGFTSPAGVWTYVTPDGKIGIEFELKQTGTTWSVVNPVISVEGTAFKTEVIASGINPPDLTSIRINANDAAAVYAYNIHLSDGKVTDSFEEIRVPDATYTWPHNKTNILTDIVITRK